MPSATPLMSFLRPLGMPRSSTLRHFLRFSTASRCLAATAPSQRKPRRTGEDANLAASRVASPSYPPPWMKSQPRPKESKASRRTSHPPKQRLYPTRQPSHSQPAPRKLIQEPIVPLSPAQCAPNLPYFITRTRSNELPVYTSSKRGGNLKLSLVKKIDGSAEALRDELQQALGLDKNTCVVNAVTKHVVIKGHVKPELEKFLKERMF